jgi:hypothetical protein
MFWFNRAATLSWPFARDLVRQILIARSNAKNCFATHAIKPSTLAL